MPLLGIVVLALMPLQAPAARTPAVTQQQAQPDQPKATLRGKVTDKDTGAPVKRAQLTLRGTGRMAEPFYATTDASGAYQFLNIDPGGYLLSCSRSGYVSSTYGQKQNSGPISPLTVNSGDDLKSYDFQLQRGGVISGTVYDEDGEPLPRTSVQVVVRRWVRGRSQVSTRSGSSTDDRGQYRIFSLSPGRYYVQAVYSNPSEGPAGAFATMFFPNAATIQDAQQIQVTGGAEVPGVDFRMRPALTYTISGQVVDDSGSPATRGNVNAMNLDMAGARGPGNGQIRPDGTFMLRYMLPGRYRLSAVISAPRGTDRPTQMSKNIELIAGDLTNVVLASTPPASVRGKIVLDGATSLSSNARVYLSTRESGPFFGPMPGPAQVNAQDLTFSIENVQPGDYDVRIIAPPTAASAVASYSGGFQTGYYVREIRVGGQDTADKGLTVSEAGISDLVIVLDFSPGKVAGHVTNDSGETASGVVAILPVDPQKLASDRYFHSAFINQKGDYSQSMLVPGDYYLIPWPDRDASRLQDPELFEQVRKLATRVSVWKSGAANEDLRITGDILKLALHADQ